MVQQPQVNTLYRLSLLLFLNAEMLSSEATNITFMVFGVNQLRFEPTIFLARGDHAIPYIIETLFVNSKILIIFYFFTVATIFQTKDKHVCN